MMLATSKLKVIHVTTHIGLIDAIVKIEPGLVERRIACAHATLAQGTKIVEPAFAASTLTRESIVYPGTARKNPRSNQLSKLSGPRLERRRPAARRYASFAQGAATLTLS
jgi:hypothetical protein